MTEKVQEIFEGAEEVENLGQEQIQKPKSIAEIIESKLKPYAGVTSNCETVLTVPDSAVNALNRQIQKKIDQNRNYLNKSARIVGKYIVGGGLEY